MLRVIQTNITGLKHPVYSALTLSFASFGDAFLYPFLPQNAALLKIPVVWVGLLLSINRFIRIAFNPIAVRLFARYGVRSITIVASATAIVSTMGYGLQWGLYWLLLCRIFWGCSFAVLRISTLAYTLDHQRIGLSMGIAKSIQETGPMFSLWLGPILLHYVGPSCLFFVFAILSFPAVLCAVYLPELRYKTTNNAFRLFRLPSLFNALTFISSFAVEGFLVVVIGKLLLQGNPSLSLLTLTSIAAGYLAYRRICSIFFSPIGGVIADRFGFAVVFNFSILMIISGMVCLLSGWITVGLIVVLLFNSISNAMAPGNASIHPNNQLKAVAINASWRDIGAAMGTLAGGFILSSNWLFETLAVTTFILTALLFFYNRQTNFR